MCGKKWLAIFALIALCSISLSASPPPSWAELSPQQRQAISDSETALAQSQAALKASSEEIAQQSKQITTLSIACGVLLVIDAGAVALGLYETFKK